MPFDNQDMKKRLVDAAKPYGSDEPASFFADDGGMRVFRSRHSGCKKTADSTKRHLALRRKEILKA
jgi:hypothetical protein